jgi:solute carrier family 35, member F3/4
VGLAVGGVLVLGLARSDGAGTGASPLLGVLLALVASLSAAVYKVLFKWAFPGALSWRRLALFLSLLGLVNVALGTAPCLLMGYSGLEERFWAADPPLSTTTWLVLLGACVLVLVFNTSIAVGIALTTPLFISIGTELTIPATMLVDVLAAGTQYTWLEWLGAALLMASFAVLLTGGEAAAGGSGADADEGEHAAGHFDSVNAGRGMVSSGQTDRERLETESHDCEQTSGGRSCVESLCSPVGR